jgi:hypothetical protein
VWATDLGEAVDQIQDSRFHGDGITGSKTTPHTTTNDQASASQHTP